MCVARASPPCTEYTIALTTRPRNLKLANRIVRRTLKILRHFRPRRWFLENPQTGYLKHQPMMRGIPFVDVDYCRFSNWGYRRQAPPTPTKEVVPGGKPTRIWYGGTEAVPIQDATCRGPVPVETDHAVCCPL